MRRLPPAWCAARCMACRSRSRISAGWKACRRPPAWRSTPISVPMRMQPSSTRLQDAGAVILGKLQLTESAYADHHPSITPPQQSLECRALAGRFLQRLRRRDRRGPMLRLARFGYRRLDPLSLRGPGPDRPQAELGPRQPLRRVRTGGDARPCRSDDAQRARCGGDAGRHRGPGSASDPTALQDPVPDYLAGIEGGVSGPAHRHGSAWTVAAADAETQDVVAAALDVLAGIGAEIVEVELPGHPPGGAGLVPALRRGDRRRPCRHLSAAARGLWPRADRPDRARPCALGPRLSAHHSAAARICAAASMR